MLFILIPIAWLAVVTFCVSLCSSAARGDEARLPGSPSSPEWPSHEPLNPSTRALAAYGGR